MTALLEARGLTKLFPVGGGLFGRGGGAVRAVDGISFAIEPGRTLGIVGESGCGKTTTAKLLLRLEEPTAGELLFDGTDVTTLNGAGLHRYRRSVQAVFQDPFASLSPRMRVGAIIAEPLVTHERLEKPEVAARIARLLDVVGLPARARPLAPAGDPRRAGLGPRCLHPRPDPEPAAGSPAGPWPRLPLHRPRPGRGGAHEPHDRRDVPGAYRGNRSGGGCRNPPRASVHAGPLRGGPARASR